MALIIPRKNKLLLLMAKVFLFLLFALVVASGVLYVLTNSHLALVALTLSTLSILITAHLIGDNLR